MKWSTINNLCLNDRKTEVIHVYSKFSHPSPLDDLVLGNAIAQPIYEARDLGVIVDSHLSMKTHVNNICTASYLGIRNIGRIRKYLDKSHY